MNFNDYIGKDAKKVKQTLENKGFKVVVKDNNSYLKRSDCDLVVKIEKDNNNNVVVVTNKFLLSI